MLNLTSDGRKKQNATSIILQKLEWQIILITGKDIAKCDFSHMSGDTIN